jgi:hypothetical protein
MDNLLALFLYGGFFFFDKVVGFIIIFIKLNITFMMPKTLIFHNCRASSS